MASLVSGSLQASGRNDGLLQQQQPDGPLLLLHQTADQERQRERGDARTHTHTKLGLAVLSCERFSSRWDHVCLSSFAHPSFCSEL